MTLGTILDPRASRDARNQDRGPAAGCLAGKRVGLRRDQFWSSWDWVTDEWSTVLRAAGAEPVIWRAPVEKGEAAVTASEEFAQFVSSIDMAIVGLCNCGSCSMWAIHDTLACLDRGLPTVSVATAHFERLARSLAELGGRHDIRMVVLPYPLEGQAEDEVRAIARTSFHELLAVAEAQVDMAVQ